MEEVKIFKIGGKVIDQEPLLIEFLQDFVNIPGKKILVHGGGKIASEFSQRMGIEAKMVNGRRVTDEQTLEIVTMVYGGLLNKKIVAALQKIDCNALGLTGADLNVIKAHRRPANPVDYGLVGEVDEVNDAILGVLLDQNVVPVMAPLTHDKQGQMFNTNADTIASGVAKALAKKYTVNLYYCFEKKGVLMDAENDDSVINLIKESEFAHLCEQKIVNEGMIPKLENAFACLNEGVGRVYICHFSAIKNLTGIDQEATLISR